MIGLHAMQAYYYDHDHNYASAHCMINIRADINQTYTSTRLNRTPMCKRCMSEYLRNYDKLCRTFSMLGKDDKYIIRAYIYNYEVV